MVPWLLLSTMMVQLERPLEPMIAEQLPSSPPPPCVPWASGKCEPYDAAAAAATKYLHDNMFAWDVPNAQSLFQGVAAASVSLALQARQRFGWAATVPRELWEQYVLPYASVNEARTDWRQLMWDAFTAEPWLHALANSSSLESVALAVNAHTWASLRPGAKPIVFRSEQTPLIFDAMSTIAFGYASCTGISITYVNALRAVGVPARLVGTPAWHDRTEDGNHNWVEVWLGGSKGWSFIEGSPAGPGETFADPCDKWFCHPSHFFANGTGTRTYAAVYGKPAAGGPHYPMEWDTANKAVAGVDRSAYYDATCSRCA